MGHFELEKKLKGHVLKSDYWFDKKVTAAVRFLSCGQTYSLIGALGALPWLSWASDCPL